MFGTLILAASAASTLSGGQPVYLTCALDDRPAWVMDVQLNEAAGTASVRYRHGSDRSIMKQAAFAPDRVTFDVFVINRTDLTFIKDNRNYTFREFDKLPLTEKGTCVRDGRSRAI